jgi:hypothetical protein
MNIVEDFEGFGAARREQKVVTANSIFGDGKHRLTAVRVEHMPRRQVDSVGVINRAARREPLRFIRLREGRQIGNLLALWVDNFQQLSAPE